MLLCLDSTDCAIQYNLLKDELADILKRGGVLLTLVSDGVVVLLDCNGTPEVGVNELGLSDGIGGDCSVVDIPPALQLGSSLTSDEDLDTTLDVLGAPLLGDFPLLEEFDANEVVLGCNGDPLCLQCDSDPTCMQCNGDQSCIQCQADPLCTQCAGDSLCISCNADSLCISCNGDPLCISCQGNSTCIACNGDPICTQCNGDALCIQCNGDPLCMQCNGDSDCIECNGVVGCNDPEPVCNTPDCFCADNPGICDFCENSIGCLCSFEPSLVFCGGRGGGVIDGSGGSVIPE